MFLVESEMFVNFTGKKEQGVLVNIKDICLVIQKGVFCDIYIRGKEDYLTVTDDFYSICKRIEEISSGIN